MKNPIHKFASSMRQSLNDLTAIVDEHDIELAAAEMIDEMDLQQSQRTRMNRYSDIDETSRSIKTTGQHDVATAQVPDNTSTGQMSASDTESPEEDIENLGDSEVIGVLDTSDEGNKAEEPEEIPESQVTKEIGNWRSRRGRNNR